MTDALERGAVRPLPPTVRAVRAVLRWTPVAAGPGATRTRVDADLSALLLAPTGRVRGEADLVFYNQPRHPSGLVRRLPKLRDAGGLLDAVEAELALLEPGVTRLLFAASAAHGFHAAASRPRLELHEAPRGGTAGGVLAVFPLAPAPGETAVVCGELARTADGGWEFRASQRGFAAGLAALAAEFGVPASPDPPPRPVPPGAYVPPRRPAPSRPDPRRHPAYGYPQPDPAFTLPPQGPQFLPGR